MQKNEIHSAIRLKLANANRIVITSHVRPDGDAVGSLLGLGLSLIAAGKQVEMVLADGVPAPFRHLTGSDLITRHIKGRYDLAIVTDCSDLIRTGGSLADRIPDINIDHHITNLNFATINLVDSGEAASSAILAGSMPLWDLAIPTAAASALLTGIISDTLGFRTSNVTSETLRLAAGLVDLGANLTDLYNRALVQRSYEAVLFWGMGLENLQRDDRMVWTYLSLEDRMRAGYSGNDDADLVNLLATIDSAEVTVVFVEQKSGHIKVSWRGVPGYDVSRIALQFGGGVHAAAAGADITGDIYNVRERVLEATRKLFNGAKTSTIRNNEAPEKSIDEKLA